MPNIDNDTLAQIDVTDDELNQELAAAFGEAPWRCRRSQPTPPTQAVDR